MNDEDLRLLAQRGSVYRLDGSGRKIFRPYEGRNVFRPYRRWLAVWLLALALAGMATLWFLWPGEAAGNMDAAEYSRNGQYGQICWDERMAPVGPDAPRPACLVEQGWIKKACVNKLGREERRGCLTARTSLMLCRMGK